jgi:hypothetical protein
MANTPSNKPSTPRPAPDDNKKPPADGKTSGPPPAGLLKGIRPK